MRKILLTCYEIPGYGGASTATYSLFQMMQADSLDVAFLNIIDEQDVDYFRYVFGESFGNPKSLPNVHNCILRGPLFYPHPELTDLIKDLAPDIFVGVGYIAALLTKRAEPEIPLAYLTTGCSQAQLFIEKKPPNDCIALIQLLNRLKGLPPIMNDQEREAVRTAELIITHSHLTKELYGLFFPSQVGKTYSDIVWFADWIYKSAFEYSELCQPFSEREIDVLFIASIWDRPVKNYKIVKELISRLRGLSIHIVGETTEVLTEAKHHGFVPKREEVFTLLANAKTIVCPSALDAAPGILFEASAMGCNIITSKNCGNWQICHDELLVDPFDLAIFLEKIPLSLNRKLDDNIDYFFRTHSYENLVDILMVL